MQRKYIPADPKLSKHIDYYWMVDQADEMFLNNSEIYSYPGLTPEIIVPQEGYFQFQSEGQTTAIHKPFISTVIFYNMVLDLRNLKRFLLVRFKTSGLASLLPFVQLSTEELMSEPIHFVDKLFSDLQFLTDKELDFDQQAWMLDEYFYGLLDEDRQGFIVDLLHSDEACCSLSDVKRQIGYSTSTLERRVKKETGLTPKGFVNFRRFRLCYQEIVTSENRDWMHYVAKYSYHDQSHFIKDIKKYSGITPEQLLIQPSIYSFRPK